jgi:PiT family inorganic phosphate transporter
MSTLIVLSIVTVGVVLFFDYTNGFQDASNVVATVVASRAMTPVQAVVLVATFEFLGPLLGGTAVANTIGGFVDLSDLDELKAVTVILCGVLAAIAWNLVTWVFGIPSSSSHGLVGGLIGATIVAAGVDDVVWGFSELANGHLTGVTKVLLGLIISPIIGFWGAFLVQRLMSHLLRGAKPSTNQKLRWGQWLTSASLAFSHGANDAQKSMGIITLLLVMGGFIEEFVVPFWVILCCAIAMTLGILSGGWRIVRTLGFGIYKLRPLHAFDTQLTATVVIMTASQFGAPVSTTHVVSSAIMGVGASERPKAVRWAKAEQILKAWVVTIPGSAVVGATGMFVVGLFV